LTALLTAGWLAALATLATLLSALLTFSAAGFLATTLITLTAGCLLATLLPALILLTIRLA
jgi:hypothetical protein